MSYEARDAETIKKHLKKPRAGNVYFVMAQPTNEAIPPFVFQIFGTDSKFTGVDVVNRWNATKRQLSK